jgi:hypothetical protein
MFLRLLPRKLLRDKTETMAQALCLCHRIHQPLLLQAAVLLLTRYQGMAAPKELRLRVVNTVELPRVGPRSLLRTLVEGGVIARYRLRCHGLVFLGDVRADSDDLLIRVPHLRFGRAGMRPGALLEL